MCKYKMYPLLADRGHQFVRLPVAAAVAVAADSFMIRVAFQSVFHVVQIPFLLFCSLLPFLLLLQLLLFLLFIS